MNTLNTLREQLLSQLDDGGRIWLRQALEQLAALAGDPETIANRLVFYTASAARKLGKNPMQGKLPSGFNNDSHGERGQVFLDHWTVSDAARVVLLAENLASDSYSPDELFQLCFQYSDEGERISLLKGLAVFKLTSASTHFIVDVARTNSLALFTALMFHNPWPAVFFPASALNQVILKSLFMGLDISHIIGLRAAKNEELGRMTADYVQERLDADRPVPASIWLVVNARLLGETAMQTWQTALESSNETERRLALQGRDWQ